MFYKPEHRQKILKIRKQLGQEAIAQAAAHVAAQLVVMAAFLESKHLGYYMAHQGECDPSVAIHCAKMLNKKLYLPVIQENNISYFAADSEDELLENKYGIKEPKIDGKKPRSLAEIDCLLMPLVGFDDNCNRLGRGAGFYDRYLSSSKNRPVLIGLAYEFQKIDKIIPDEWDVPLDFVVTEDRVYERIVSL